ncbi:MAG: dinitrogenase iron-molybdenum cofactor biosynthesis domain-containing protein [Desulfobulbus propionicus]|nr:MAG: dinitrogenase iron-molybdenum cofactor biosynthesis domain-containing protein [Desulfobulbus propionicus]
MNTRPSEIKVAVTAWGDRVSPVFDAAQKLLIVTIAEANIIDRHLVYFDSQHVAQLIQMLKNEKVAALICGAVSEEPALLLETADFELIPFISGQIDEVLAMLMSEQPVWSMLKMPGCGKCCQGQKRNASCVAGRIRFLKVKKDGRDSK